MYLPTDRLKAIYKALEEAPTCLYNFNKIKAEMLKYYSDKLVKLNQVSEEHFKNFDFVKELIQRCEAAEKESKRDKLTKIVFGLDRHRYAPELNNLVLISGKEIKTPGAVTVQEAIDKVLNSSSITELNKIILTNSKPRKTLINA